MAVEFCSGKPKFCDGKPAFGTCGGASCTYSVVANLTRAGTGGGAHLYGAIDGGDPVHVYLADPRWPAAPPYTMRWTNAVNAEAISSGTGFPDAATIDSAHSYRFWWANDDDGNPPDAVLGEVTITLIDAMASICVNGNTLNAGTPTITLDFTADEAPGDGDQRAFGGGFALDIACGVCP